MSAKLKLDRCVCHSEKPFLNCCGPFVSQEKVAKTPLQLMRSRYSAFALGGYGEYLLATWHPTMRVGLSQVELSVRLNDWVKLDVLTKSRQGEHATVEFKAHYVTNNGKAKIQHEKSTFKRLEGRWYYFNGEII